MKNFRLRPAVISDIDILLEWKNEPSVRQSAFNSAVVSYDEHKAWFCSALKNPDIKIFILEKDGEPVGQVRLNRSGRVGLIDYSVDKKFRGNGFGKQLIRMIENEVAQSCFVDSLKAEVKKDNLPSCAVFRNLGYTESEEKDSFVFIKKINRIIIISSKSWHKKYVDEVSARTGCNVVYIDQKEKVSYDYLKQYNPRYIFFPHWSYIIPAEVYDNFECVIFHMTDLPFGRGGSPLQNLVERGIYETKVSAIRCCKELDGGDVYMKKPLSLWGTAEEIYLRAAELTKEMMIEIATATTEPEPQNGQAVVFKRRKPEQSDISRLESLEKVFDYIRMLDAEGYPHAFIDAKRFHFEFERASLKDGYIKADVKISLREALDE